LVVVRLRHAVDYNEEENQSYGLRGLLDLVTALTAT
jgi:hypothetical protein